MDTPFTLILAQVDTINLSLSKALAITRIVVDCGKQRQPTEDEPNPASLFVVMLTVADELEKIDELVQSLRRL
ncbi:MAG: hypothetical protein HQM06_14690 [Magnetococcales bacterium]|nr:hypothetical protein [Magnetococcales bacterium]